MFNFRYYSKKAIFSGTCGVIIILILAHGMHILDNSTPPTQRESILESLPHLVLFYWLAAGHTGKPLLLLNSFGLLVLPWLAILYGELAHKELKSADNEYTRGRRLATFGLWVGYLTILSPFLGLLMGFFR